MLEDVRYRIIVPTTITLLNLSCGVAAIYTNKPFYLLLFILAAAIFDIFDGILARLLKAQSEFGKQLDSLSDIVSFGVAPAIGLMKFVDLSSSFLLVFFFLIPTFSAIRLAKFNIDNKQKSSFRGLPTPANGLFFSSLPYLLSYYNIMINPLALAGIIILFSALMVTNLRMFSFKKIGAGGADTIFPIIFLVLLIIGSLIFSFSVVPIAVILYVLISIVYHFFTINN